MFANLPSGWEQLPQQAVAKFYNGRAYKLKEWEDTGTPVIRLQNLTGSGNKFYYSKLKLPEHQYCVKGDLLYMWSATFGPHIWDGDRAIYHYHIWKVEQAHNKLDRTFHFFILSHLTEQWKSGANGMAMLHLTKKGMEQLTIPVPPLSEQKRIAEILTAVDDSIRAGERVIEQTERVKKGLMEELLTGGLGSAAIERGEVPTGWRQDVFEKLVRLKRGYDLPVSQRIEGSVPVVASNGPVGTHNSPAVEGPVVVTGRSGTIGKVALYETECHPLNTTLYSQKTHGNNIRYIYYFLCWFRLGRFGTGTGVPTLNRNDVHAQQIVIPSLPEQKRIATILTSIDDQIEAERKHVEQQKRLKQGLMDDLLTGRVRTV
ncbi:restriction endonuclease subunit S [Oceanicaulis sp.]|uniref:restriction endonuclease subunit S n=1 Tax=Oceanicaulis sp. TaxID=1924941 RepID=UPI003BAA9C50